MTAHEIATGIEEGVKHSRVRLNDRRLLLIFLFVVIIGVYFFWRLDQQTNKINTNQHNLQTAVYNNCTVTDQGNAKVNVVLKQLAANAQNSTALTPAQKQEAIATYVGLNLPIVDCSKLAYSFN